MKDKALIPSFSIKHPEELPFSMQHFRLWMLRFAFNIVYVVDENLVIADTISRAPLMAPDQHDQHFEEDVDVYMEVIFQGLPATEQRLEEIRFAQENKPLCQEVD